jgi:hypothetical protein
VGDPRRTFARIVFLFPAAAGLIAYFVLPPILQPESYHVFADRRSFLGVPNFLNVISNVPFAFVGVLGLRKFRDMASRVLFGGIFLVAIGSGYYHWQPNTPSLAWDRAPMTVAFMALLALMIGECWSANAMRRALWPLVALGLFSVVWWRVSGDLRLYGLVQFVPILTIVAAVLVFPAPRNRYLWATFLLYATAKLCERFDVAVYSAIDVSGHTIKHLLAAYSTYWIYRWRAADGAVGTGKG